MINNIVKFYLQRAPAKKAKGEKNKNGDEQFELGKNRKVTVRSFKGKVLVDIREYYSKDGEELPGKKGISLQPEQWKKLVEFVDDINDAVAKI